MYRLSLFLIATSISFSGCQEIIFADETPEETAAENAALNEQLGELIATHNLDRDATRALTLPDIESPMAQLGKKLFFSRSLSGDLNVACASCHHPALAGADELSLTIGVNAIEPNVLGSARQPLSDDFNIGRHSPTVFNLGLWREALFWDGRVEQLGGGISTPDSGHNSVDHDASSTLAAAQAMFPVTSREEMLGQNFATFEDNDTVRDHLAQRMGRYGNYPNTFDPNEWLTAFQQAFGSSASADELIRFENIAHAIGEYQRSMVFINSPWQQFVEGDTEALTPQQKRGAVLFMTDGDDGAACIRCHRGPTFTDEQFNLVAFPQFGPLTDDLNGDVGRESFTGNRDDRYRFRTPSLLNVALTAPYGHAGTYATLEEVIEHYDDPERSVREFFDDERMCDLSQFRSLTHCATLFENAEEASELNLDEIQRNRRQGGNGQGLPNVQLSNQDQEDLVAFLESLTDPCAASVTCLAPWIADEFLDNPDGHLLQAQF